MSYTFSFNSAPPIGFSINPQTGLITVAANASPFTGNLSIRVSDGVSSAIKSIPIALTAPTITPLLSTVSRVKHRGGGRVVAIPIGINPVIHHGGGQLAFAVQAIPVLAMTHRGGTQRTVGFNEEATPIGVIECVIKSYWGDTLAVGQSNFLLADVTIDYDTTGVDQSVIWSIDSGPYSNYGTVSATGVVTVANGAFYPGDAIFTVRATSVAYPNFSDTYEVYAIDRFDSIQITPSPTTVAGGQTFTIASLLIGAGQDLNGLNTQYISVTINEGGNYTYLSGPSVNYTAGASAGNITISASYYYQGGGYVVNGSTIVQNTGASAPPSGLTIVPSYTVTKTGGTSWESLSWATLNDGSHLTGAAVGDGTGQPTIAINLGSALTIKKIRLAGGDFDANFSPEVAPYLNGGFLEYSTNAGVTWTPHATISGVVDTPNTFKDYDLSVAAQYWRLRRAEYIATTAFVLYT